jgi:hypothetical protein
MRGRCELGRWIMSRDERWDDAGRYMVADISRKRLVWMGNLRFTTTTYEMAFCMRILCLKHASCL